MTPEEIAEHDRKQEALDAWDYAVDCWRNGSEFVDEGQAAGIVAAELLTYEHENAPFGPPMFPPAAVAEGF